MPQIPTTFPAIFGSYALLKQLSDEGERSVYLVATSGATKPWVMKTIPVQGAPALDLGSLNGETQSLCRMGSAHLAKMLDCKTIGGDVAVVMEHVPGRSLAAICGRAEALSVLLPSELGVILAHDAFAAMEYFHDFEGASRVHGNLSSRTILVGYSGEVKVAGYRPGLHPCAEVDVQVAKDLMPLANILCDLPFRMFPQALVRLVPRLLEESISPVEAMAVAKAFLRGHVPSADDRRKVSSWLDEIFPGERDREAQDSEQLLAAGIKLLEHCPSEPRPLAQDSAIGDDMGEDERSPGSRRSWLKVVGIGMVASLVLAGGAALLIVNRRGPVIPRSKPHEPEAGPLAAQGSPDVQPDAVPPAPDRTIPVPAAPVAPTAPVSHTQPRTGARHSRPAKRKPEPAFAEHLLRAADAAFDRGNHVEAITLGTQALNAGGGVRAHLALANYYRKMSRYREALQHYRAAIKLDPENAVAATGIKVVEKQLLSSP